MTTEELARVLYEELERDQWGDIDPYWLKMIATGADSEDEDDASDVASLRAVLDRVVARLD